MLRSAFQIVSNQTQGLARQNVSSFREVENSPEVRPQIDDLPRAKSNKHTHSPKGKPFDSLIRALVGISELLLSSPEILHLSHDLIDSLLDSAQLGLDRLQLLRGLNTGPVFGVGANVDIELDVSGGS
jgi:hypothetical protein